MPIAIAVPSGYRRELPKLPIDDLLASSQHSDIRLTMSNNQHAKKHYRFSVCQPFDFLIALVQLESGREHPGAPTSTSYVAHVYDEGHVGLEICAQADKRHRISRQFLLGWESSVAVSPAASAANLALHGKRPANRSISTPATAGWFTNQIVLGGGIIRPTDA